MNYLGIPTIDCEDYLLKTLVTCNSKYPFRTFVLNNGKPLEYEYEGIEIENNGENIGISKSWNRIINWAINHDDCESIFILNDDVELGEGCLDYMVDALEIYDITGAYATKNLDIIKDPRFVPGVHFSCFAISPTIPMAIGLFDENYTPFHVEDTDYWKRLIEAGFLSGTDRKAKFIHYKIRPRGNAKRWIENGRELTVEEIHNRNRAYFVKKHGVSPKEWYGRSVEGSRR